MPAQAVFFDVDFTLIAPGPAFQGSGYRTLCERHGMSVDESRFEGAVASAASLLDNRPGDLYDAELYVDYTRHIIEQMGGRGPAVDGCAREIYREWAACRHFDLYDEVPAVLNELASAGIRIGLISNSHRCLTWFQSHFELQGLITTAVSSAEHGVMKPHPRIFAAALSQAGVQAADSVMVGDSVRHDIEGALAVGMRAVLIHRDEVPHPLERELIASGVPVIRSLTELARLVV